MQMDSFFIMGKSHKVCEDYAICEYDNDRLEQMAAISDGCSSSKDTDFGSRILLKLLFHHIFPCTPLLARGFWSHARSITEELFLSPNCLDATLNIAITNNSNNTFEVFTIGDGFVVAQLHSGNYQIIEIEYDQNAPYYLAYDFNEGRKKEFMKLGQKKIVTTKEYDLNGSSITEIIDKDDPVDFYSNLIFPYDTYKSVSVFSDGLKTFSSKDDQKLPLEQIVKELITFPQTTGEFVKRRCTKFLKVHPEYSFVDDFSMATLTKV